jgi:hypothetical protein
VGGDAVMAKTNATDKIMKKLFVTAALAATTLLSLNASADGLVANPSDIAQSQRAKLQQEIATAKVQNPAVFEQIRNISGHKPETYKRFRNPIPLVGRELRRFGPAGLMPMLEALAFDMWERGDATDAEWLAVKVGMLEAVSVLHDARSQSVVEAAFANAKHAKVMSTAAEAVGALCMVNKAEVKVLQKALSTSKRSAAIVGLGNCRTVEAAQILATELDSAKTEAEADHIARALGTVSSSWAWRAMGTKSQVEGLNTRRIASEALVRSFVRFRTAGREGARVGITMAQHPDIRSIADLNRGAASHAVLGKLGRLVDRVEKRAKR